MSNAPRKSLEEGYWWRRWWWWRALGRLWRWHAVLAVLPAGLSAAVKVVAVWAGALSADTTEPAEPLTHSLRLTTETLY